MDKRIEILTKIITLYEIKLDLADKKLLSQPVEDLFDTRIAELKKELKKYEASDNNI